MCTDDYHYNRYTLARAYHANGKYAEAIGMLQRALARVPLEVSEDRHNYQTEMVSVLEAMGDLDAGRVAHTQHDGNSIWFLMFDRCQYPLSRRH